MFSYGAPTTSDSASSSSRSLESLPTVIGFRWPFTTSDTDINAFSDWRETTHRQQSLRELTRQTEIEFVCNFQLNTVAVLVAHLAPVPVDGSGSLCLLHDIGTGTRTLPAFDLATILADFVPPHPQTPTVANVVHWPSYEDAGALEAYAEVLDKAYIAKDRVEMLRTTLSAVFTEPDLTRYTDDPTNRWWKVELSMRRGQLDSVDPPTIFPHLFQDAGGCGKPVHLHLQGQPQTMPDGAQAPRLPDYDHFLEGWFQPSLGELSAEDVGDAASKPARVSVMVCVPRSSSEEQQRRLCRSFRGLRQLRFRQLLHHLSPVPKPPEGSDAGTTAIAG
ncbi:MAG: hypothetical protein JWP57_3988 [Spirosoma sp.]|nr:hypothetical protein [Spirosoma sp.]